MRRVVGLTAALFILLQSTAAYGQPAKPLVTGLKRPDSIAVGGDGKVYVTLRGEPDKKSSGAVVQLDKTQAIPFVADLDDPRGLVAFQKWVFVVDGQRILRIDAKGKAEVFVASDAFPTPPIALGALTVDVESGSLYVCDEGDKAGKGAAIYRVTPKGGPKVKMPTLTVTSVTDQKRWPELVLPRAVVMDGASFLLVSDSSSGNLYRVNVADGSTEKVASNLGRADGLAWDQFGRLYISDGRHGSLSVIARPGQPALTMVKDLVDPAGISRDPTGKFILVADAKAGTITPVLAQVPGAAVDDRPLDFKFEMAFGDLKWTDWKKESDKGIPIPLRPIVLTHPGDGSNRIFVAIQQGTIHVFPNDPKADKTQVFLDIQERVSYKDKENEEGFLGLAFHPQYKKNGEFFVFYTVKSKNKHINVVSRFHVSKDDPNRADPASEEELLRIEHGFWNHDGGTLCFGPDGYLYIATGDGGSANDPFNNGQNLNTLLAKVLRIDVDHKDGDLKYAIPKDNPFVDRKDARPETWAYGLRNIWRMSFDRKTGWLWAGDVGQNLFEEIDIIVKGGNYGWKVREGLHPFSVKGSGPRKDLIDPIWEYHHNLGVCIIGGYVYRGRNLPELDGAYIYGDYPSGKVWALRYDDTAKRVVANRPLRTPGLPMLSFGEDELGEVYLLTDTLTGKGIYLVQRGQAGTGR
jgi:glucose/arabinose dehydrogenase